MIVGFIIGSFIMCVAIVGSFRMHQKGYKSQQITNFIELCALVIQIVSVFCGDNIINGFNTVNSNNNTVSNFNYFNDYQSNAELLQEVKLYFDAGDWENVLQILSSEQLKADGVVLSDIGYLYSEGIGLKQDLAKAEEYYQKAIECGYDEARLSLLGVYLHHDLGKAVEYITVNQQEQVIQNFLEENLSSISNEKFEKLSDAEKEQYILTNWYEEIFVETIESKVAKSNSTFVNYVPVSARTEIDADEYRTINYYSYDVFEYQCRLNDSLYYDFRTE